MADRPDKVPPQSQSHQPGVESETHPQPQDEARGYKGAEVQSRLWLIEPVADPDDSMWQDRPIWAEVVVAAPSPAFARLAAERRALPAHWTPVGNGSDSRRSGLNDEQLYHVRELPDERRAEFPPAPRDGDVLLMRELRPARRP